MKYFFYFVTCMASLIFLTGCGSHSKFKDLEDFFQGLEKNTKQAPAVASLKPLQPSAYQKKEGRTPFEDYSAPSRNSQKIDNPLQMYQLNLLQFVGTVSKNDQVYAYITTPDNKIYEVKKGDTIGDHNGKIINISADKVQVVEQSSEEGQQPTEKIITLQLKDES